MTEPIGSNILKIYFRVWAALMVLLILTVVAWRMDLGPLAIFVAMLIAVVKALLVILYFMHVKYSSRVVWVFVGAGFFWLAIMIGISVTDVTTRHWTPQPTRFAPTHGVE